MDQQRQQVYLNLIQQLLFYHSREEINILLQQHQQLIDENLLQLMEARAQQLEEEGNQQQAQLLINIAQQLAQYLNHNPPTQASREDYYNFLIHTLQLIDENNSDPKIIYSYWQQYQQLLDQTFAQILTNWYQSQLKEANRENQSYLAAILVELGNLIQQFPLGNQGINLEIGMVAYENALEIYTREAFPVQWAGTQNNLAAAYCDRIKGDKAENLEKAITSYENALEITTREAFPVQWADTQNNLGLAYWDRIKGNKAENLEKAITSYENALEITTREAFPVRWAETQNNLGLAYWDRIKGNKAENLEKAITSYENALEIRTHEAFPVQWSATQNNLGIAYRNRIKGDKAENLEKGITSYENALEIRTREAFPVQWAETQNNLAAAYWDRIKGNKAENLEKAITSYENALEITTREAFPVQWAETQNNLAIAYRNRIKGDRAENLEKGITCAENALEITTREAFPVRWATTQNNLGLAYWDRIKGNKAENLEKALACAENALEIRNRKAFPVQWATTQNNLAAAYGNRIKGDKVENLEKAISLYREALTILTLESLPLYCLQTNQNLGNLGFKEGNWQLAIEGYSQAIEAIENLRSEAISEIRRQEIMTKAIAVYQNVVQSYINLEQIDKAIEYVERSKTRDLVELLANRDLYPKGNIPQAVITELDRLRREIVTEGKQLANQETSLNNNLRLGNSPDTPQPTIPNRTKLNQLKQELDNLIKDQITPEDPNFRLTQKVETISFAEIKNLTDDNTAIIQWYITDDKILTFIVTADSQQPIIKQLSSEDFNALIDEINNYLNLYLTDNKEWPKNLESFLEKFAQHLHLDETLAQIPNNCHSLILIPHRFLHLLPIHSLPITKVPPFLRGARGDQTKNLGKAKYLLDLFPNGVKYAPSCQLLQLVNQQKRNSFDNLFGIQNPTNDLTYTDIEVETIRQLFKPNDEVLIKDDATKEKLTKQNLNQTNCTHFSTHGYFNFQEPLKSALLLANCLKQNTEEVNRNSEQITRSPQGETLDLEKCLTLGEIFNLDLRNCSLVTLSACETGLTDLRNVSDEYISLPSGFLFAGSTNVISSLWAVNDLSTAFLIIKLYQNLFDYLKKGETQDLTSIPVALNQAQLWLRNITKAELQEWIKKHNIPLNKVDQTNRSYFKRFLYKMQDNDQPFQNPYYWAAFCAIGE